MLKITRIELPAMVLKLEGKLVGPWVDEFRAAVDPKSRLTQIDLAAVTFVDREGVKLLLSLQSRGVQLVNSTQFITELLQSEVPHAR